MRREGAEGMLSTPAPVLLTGYFIEKTGRTPPTSKVGDECHFFKCEK